MKLTLKEYRRLQYKARALDRVCRILWPGGADYTGKHYDVLVKEIRQAIGDYRPGAIVADETAIIDEETHRKLAALADEH